MQQLLFFITVLSVSIHAMKIQKELGLPAPSSFGTPLKFVAKLPRGFWPPLIRIPVCLNCAGKRQEDLHTFFSNVPGIKERVDKGHAFELQTAEFMRQEYRDSVRGFCMDLFIETPEEKIKSDFDVVTGERIVECKSSTRLSRVRDQIKKQLKMLTIIREIVRGIGVIKIDCEKHKERFVFRAGKYRLSSCWVNTFITPNSKKPIDGWIRALRALAIKTYTFCYPQLGKSGKKRLAHLKDQHQDIDFISIV